MGVYETEWLRRQRTRPAGEGTFRWLTILTVALFVAYLSATLAGMPRQTSSLIFSVAVFPLPFLVWWAYARAPLNVRPTVLLCAWAATLWLAGSIVWYGFFLANGSEIPPSPGVWDICFVAARLLLIAAVLVAMRSLVSVRIALLDACVIVAAGVALGAAFIGRGLEANTSASALLTLNRPLLSIVTLMLIASAALASLEGMPRSIVLIGLGEVGITVGSLLYSYAAVQGDYVDDRWANLSWSAGAGLSMLAAATIILRADRPVRPVGAHRLPGHRPGSRAVLLVSLVAISLALGVALYGLLTSREQIAVVGVIASAVVAVAMALRARDSIASAESASEQLDQSLAESERVRDELRVANTTLQRALVDFHTLRIVVAEGLNLIDERSEGRLRSAIDEACGDLIATVDHRPEDSGDTTIA